MGGYRGAGPARMPAFARVIASPSGCRAASRPRSCFLACSRMGYVCNTSLHRDYTCKEIVALIERAGSAAFFAQPGYGADAAKHDIFSMLGALAAPEKDVSARTASGRYGRERPAHRFWHQLVACRGRQRFPSHAIPIASFISPSPPARPGRPKGSCIRTIRCLRMAGRLSRTGGSTRYGGLFIQSHEPQYRDRRLGRRARVRR